MRLGWAIPLVGGALAIATGTALALHEPTTSAPGYVLPGDALLVDHDALAAIDHQRLHADVLPSWSVSQGTTRDLTMDEARRMVEGDPNLLALLAKTEAMANHDPVEHRPDLFGLIDTWNAYLDAGNQPWRLAGEIRLGADRNWFFLKSYRVIYDDTLSVGEHPLRARIERRVDATTLIESYLGHTHGGEGGVVVLLDRVTVFAMTRIWPMLAPDAEGPFAEPLHAELRAALGPEDFETLSRTADGWAAMERARNAIHERHDCGSEFVVSSLPYNGLAPSDIGILEHYAKAEENPGCPDVTAEEAQTFRAQSHALQAEPELRRAVERLVGHVTRAVTAHEARHAADVAALKANLFSCQGCPSSSRTNTLELSAYLASFAEPGLSITSLYQACALDPELLPDRAAVIAFAAERLGGSCEAPPADVAARAAEQELALFGRSERLNWESFPVSFPVSRSYQTR